MGSAQRGNPFNQWRRDHESKPFDVFDRFGRQVQEGDVVMVQGMGMGEVFFRVARMAPDLTPRGPNAPTNLVSLTLAAVFPIACAGGVPTVEFIKVRDTSELPSMDQSAAPEAEGTPTEENLAAGSDTPT